ncbi:hypothetical protein EG329_012800 [Mollisiaceae sp. DMI_Dod_QoI]|nr:hypothetical protein EG329_012800 [Helotiales sp. DMI_Dod_QoI]
MAPEKKHPCNEKNCKSPRHLRVTSNYVNLATNSASPTNGSGIDQSPSANTSNSLHHYTSRNDEFQMNETTYLSFDRPWEQPHNAENYLAPTSGTSPMERWQRESMLDEPWHGIEGIAVCDGPGFMLSGHDNMMDDLVAAGLHGQTEGADSTACERPSSDKCDT